MSELKNTIAVYGTLRKGNGNSYAMTQHGNDAYKLLGLSRVIGWEIYSLGGFPGASPNASRNMTVEVYKVNDAVLRSVRGLEGYDPDSDNNDFYNEVGVSTEFGTAKMYQYVDGRGNCDIIESGDWNEFKGIE